MEPAYKNIFKFISIFYLTGLVWVSSANAIEHNPFVFDHLMPLYGFAESDSTECDTCKVELPFNFKDNQADPNNPDPNGGLFLSTPENIQTEVQYDAESGNYNFNSTVGGTIPYRNPRYMTFDEYIDYNMDKSENDYWKEKSAAESFNQGKGFRPQLDVKSDALDRIFGGSTVDIRPSGSAELTFGVKISKTENPAIPEKQRRMSTFDFSEKIQLNVIGSIGDKMKLATSYNTEASFEFENQMKLEYAGQEDEIIKKIEAGNVSLPLGGSLITGSQSLFGLKSQLQFGRLMVTSVFSQQKGKKSEIEVQGGAQISEFEVKADRYEQNKHFFLSHYFRDLFETAVASPPLINSQVNITKIEVWVTNTTNKFENTRNIIGFQDLGEANADHIFSPQYAIAQLGNEYPYNEANSLYQNMVANTSVRAFVNSATDLNQLGFQARKDYQKVELARKLSENEFSYQSQLGYISLNQQLNPNQTLCVAYQYTINGQTFQVGEFSTDGVSGTSALYLKMLKSTELNTKIPMWDLMMKNVYPIGAYQVKKDGFMLEVWYNNSKTGVEINYIPEGDIKGKQLIKVLGLDKLNVNNGPQPDGVFDFLDSPMMTINANNGRVVFPKLEPFGSALREAIGAKYADKYAFDSLYTTTQANAQVRFPDKNRFSLKGLYKSTVTSEISLNAINIPPGSVTVQAGQTLLQENTDYTVDYTLGRVKIINQSYLESGVPIKVSLESQSLFNIQSKTLFATRFDYTVSDDFTLGGTVMNLSEKPLTPKINIGDEPMSNTIWGVDGTWRKESQLLTTLVDKIPLIDTKAKSMVTVSGEFAQLIPGHSNAVGKDGRAYIDDFEGSQSSIDIKSFTTWSLASTPQGQDEMFPEGKLMNDVGYGINRAKLGWYVIDPLFFRDRDITPKHIKEDVAMQSNHFMREVLEKEVFPNKDINPGIPQNIPTLDLAFYPNERGPYNYDVDGAIEKGGELFNTYGYGIEDNGNLSFPEKRWGGIMRNITTNDFDAANIEFIQFWLMDPYAEAGVEGFPDLDMSGQLYFNIGNISEDVLRDSKKAFENGLPSNIAGASNLEGLDEISMWGRVPDKPQIVTAFDNDLDARETQDVGLDGLRDEEEARYFRELFLDKIDNRPGLDAKAKRVATLDPSSDNFTYFRNDKYDADSVSIVGRYKKYNGLDGNSPTADQSALINEAGYPASASTIPNGEDISRDNTLDEIESYYQYKVNISQGAINENKVGSNYITDVLVNQNVSTKDGRIREVKWYQFKIPIKDFEKSVGGISDFRSIRFIRMYMRGFNQPVFLRFARLELIRGEWRKYHNNMSAAGEEIGDESEASFNISAVNIEENGSKTPVNYILPPDITREVSLQTTNLQKLNEQSMSFEICGLKDGAAVAAYKNVDLDLISYKKIKMYVHAEAADNEILEDYDLNIFVRIGTDFEDNYYEYELPLRRTPAAPPTGYAKDSDADRLLVWPSQNDIEISLKQLRNVKLARNELGIPTHIPHKQGETDGIGQYTIVGNPTLSGIQSIMIGVRNPRAEFDDFSGTDDGLDKCAEIWVNELRLTEFEESSGWAAIGRVNAKLADFANVSLSGSMSTPGFGSVEKKVSERQREVKQQVDGSTTVELGKFLPEKAGVKIPMYLGYSQGISKPQYHPLAPDLETDDYVEQLDWTQRPNARETATSVIERKGINFTNVRKEKGAGSKKPHIYDISNMSATYAYNEQDRHDINIKKDVTKSQKAGFSYVYSGQPKNVKPFKKVKALRKSKYLRPIRDFNYYPGPKQLSFRSDMRMDYNERYNRNNYPEFVADMAPNFNKSFNWGRQYNAKYDLSKALKFDFTATNTSVIIDDYSLDGLVDDSGINNYDYDKFKSSVYSQIGGFGTTTDYRHSSDVNYTLPLNKIPITDWVNATTRYSADYNWIRAPFAADSLGHTIQNSSKFQINGTFNMTTLYNKVGYLKKVNNKFRKKGRKKRPTAKKPPPKKEGEDEEEEKKKKKNDINALDYALQTLMALKNVSATYANNRGLLLPGYAMTTQAMGMDPSFSAPGAGFIFGQQDNFSFNGNDSLTFAEYAGLRDWLVKQPTLNQQFSSTLTQNFNLRASIQPAQDLKIDITAVSSGGENLKEYYRFDDDLQQYVHQNTMVDGNFSTSFGTWRTAFVKDGDDDVNAVFEQFLANRKEISQRLGQKDGNLNNHNTDVGYKEGYGATSTEVLIPAFLAAYSGSGTAFTSLKAHGHVPKPNWGIRYTGLSKIEALKEIFKTVTLNHAYRSTYSGSYTTNLMYNSDPSQNFDQNMNYIPEYQINTITISEQFAPFVNVDMTWQNSLITKVEWKKDRQLSMSFANTQLTEQRGNEFVVGLGYRFTRVKFPIQLKPGQNIFSDFNIRGDLSVRKSKTVIRKAIEGINEPTAGTNTITVKITGDYRISDQLNLRLFYDRVVNNPVVSTSFPTANTSAGVTIRFTLGGM